MERSGSLEERQDKAKDFIKALIDNANSKSSEELAQSITNLAFSDGNPVRDLFITAVPNSQTTATPPRTLKSRSSSKFLRLTRRDNKSTTSESKTPIFSHLNYNQKPVIAESSSNVRTDGNHTTPQNSLPTGESSTAENGIVPYACVLCHENMSSKGVCKRHLDEQHVSPKVFKCERCGEDFPTKSDAKKHCNRCGLGVFTFNVVKPPVKRIYASEFTEEWFSSKSIYLEHLLKLSKSGATRLPASLHCKLRALLSHPSLRQHVDDLSQTFYGSTMAWRSMRWSDEQLQKAIEQLEAAAVVHENGMVDFTGPIVNTQQILDVRLFLQNLLGTSTLSVSSHFQPIPEVTEVAEAAESIRQGRQLSIATTMSRRTTPPPAEDRVDPTDQRYVMEMSISPKAAPGEALEEVPSVTHELKVKRHLSDDSRFYAPTREPPGPPHDLDVPDSASTNLPYRSFEEPENVQQPLQGIVSQAQPYPSVPLANATPSAAASQSTLVSNYREPELVMPSPIDYSMWNAQQGMNYVTSFQNPGAHGLSYFGYPSNASMRAPSISTVATDQTCVDLNQEQQQQYNKVESFLPLDAYPAATFDTFLLNNNGQHQFQGMNQ